ncbi:sigma-70 family RNA polymerase sigma factor [Enterococcus gilvus]|uniref:Sigma-70 family RNA polymerase sigma factor n=1 Tax=Enterococcus gilvus ATCC BAA-350 TaxID=1158614 RepID=R2VCS8_9ENTE|nr:sigma-70 family RNA polymerase sigma factor [Enterococcus gilvus]EOI55441.1 sigma-70 family RNA polymerase sigma factor [Enterococcus gilvus ATCC BAA-350]EOW82016.1 hypothetical protein I592_01317 [Enterococcus gilvus ATCC BAA-350]OJG43045.1 sigma-70 family RNA polymerase sigma factor [Enterococcus gilvus]
MQDENAMNAMFVRYIQKAMINEKLNYIRDGKKKGIDIIHDENLLNNVQYQNVELMETIPKGSYSNLEDYIEDDNLSNAISKLTARQKLIIYKRYVEGWKDPSIAKELGISSQAVSKQRRKAIKKLEKFLTIGP